MNLQNYSFRLTILVLINLFFSFSLFSQVKVDWLKTFNSAPNLVDYGREMGIDPDGNIFVCGHSFVNTGQEAVTCILKYSNEGQEIWTKFTEAGVNMEDFKIDIDGNFYISGDQWNGINFDILLIKFNNDGDELWRKYFEGGHWDRSFAIALDNSGNIYQTGVTWYQPQYYDFVTIKYNSQGDTLWTKRYTSTGQFSDYAKKIILDNEGNLYVAGFADQDIALIKYTPSGKQVWDRKVNMNFVYNELFSPHIEIDNHDNLFVCGTRYNSVTRSDIIVGKYDSSGSQQWLKVWNSANNDSDVISGDAIGDEAMAIDNNGNVYLTGTTVNSQVPFGDNVVTLKYDAQGNFQWSHIYNGPADDWDRPYSIKVSNSGNVYVCGETVEAVTSLVPMDYLTFKLNTNGELQWVRTFNGVGNFYDKAAAMVIDDRENVIVTGISSQDGEIFDGNRDIVTIKYSQSTTGIVTSTNIFSGYELSQNYPNPFNPNTIINYQLSTFNHVELKVYNLLGSEVNTLVNAQQTAGNYSVEFDGSNLPSGTYFYRLIVDGNTIDAKRMTMLK